MLNYLEKAKIFAISDFLDINNIKNIDQKKVAPFKNKKKSLIISSFLMSKNLFCENLFTI